MRLAMSEDHLENLQESLAGIGASLRGIEQKLVGQDTLAGQINYLFATVSAIDFVLKRMMASHAATFPFGVICEMLNNEEMVMASINAYPELTEEHRKVMTFHLTAMLRDVRALLVQSQSSPPQKEESSDS
jgi:hypothetical protein